MFGIVVIPRDSVVIQKSEQSVAILLEAALIFSCAGRFETPFGYGRAHFFRGLRIFM
jgi:hypothetical protein